MTKTAQRVGNHFEIGLLRKKYTPGMPSSYVDIREMCSQLQIRPEVQHSQRFLWRYGDVNQTVQHFVMTSMTFGAICSPCCAVYTKNLNASEYAEKYSETIKTIIDMYYVDDFLCSFKDEDEAFKICKSIVEIHSEASFELRGFV